MRQDIIFFGSSHVHLAHLILQRLGIRGSPLILKRYHNRETHIELGVSVRNEHVFVIQSGSPTINDHIMEVLFIVQAAKLSGAKTVTVIMPYFPYCKMSRKRRARSGIPAKVVANMLSVSGVDHVITMDLPFPQTRGFFNIPIDNLMVLPTFAHHIRNTEKNEGELVIVGQNADLLKRVTQLADMLKTQFALFHATGPPPPTAWNHNRQILSEDVRHYSEPASPVARTMREPPDLASVDYRIELLRRNGSETALVGLCGPPVSSRSSTENGTNRYPSSSRSSSQHAPPHYQGAAGQHQQQPHHHHHHQHRRKPQRAFTGSSGSDEDIGEGELESEDDAMGMDKGGSSIGEGEDPDVGFTDDTWSLVGDVKDKLAVVVLDTIDSPENIIRSANVLVGKFGAQKVYIIATHAILSRDAAQVLQACGNIHKIIVTNSYPISKSKRAKCPKLIVLDISGTLAEAIRRKSNGESFGDIVGPL